MLGVQWKRGNFFRNFLLWNGVRWARLELAQDYSHYPLKVACLPFHHHRFVLGLQIYAQFLQVQTFLRFFCKKVNFYAENQLIKLSPPGNLRKTQERHSHSQPFFFLELTCYVRKQASCRIINLCITHLFLAWSYLRPVISTIWLQGTFLSILSGLRSSTRTLPCLSYMSSIQKTWAMYVLSLSCKILTLAYSPWCKTSYSPRILSGDRSGSVWANVNAIFMKSVKTMSVSDFISKNFLRAVANIGIIS